MINHVVRDSNLIVHTRTDGKIICIDCQWYNNKCILGLYNKTSCNRYEYIKPVKDNKMKKEKVRELIAQAWCTKENEHKEMDVVLAETIVDIIINKILKKE